jgi:hypothetical protein
VVAGQQLETIPIQRERKGLILFFLLLLLLAVEVVRLIIQPFPHLLLMGLLAVLAAGLLAELLQDRVEQETRLR